MTETLNDLIREMGWLRSQLKEVTERVERLEGNTATGLDVDHATGVAHLHGTRLHLTVQEARIIALLATDPRRVYTYDEVHERLRPGLVNLDRGSSHTWRSAFRRLRVKLAAVDDSHPWVICRRGVGVSLV